ncbi:autophagy-related 18f isoform X1 [Olea europaea subsp. europaea]|uniref:Autophagy-related 18f isoform X1 n=1 Tax=Olea europaea subsp. europaea TaxID=158383 RepID=A0A8S0TRX4_OLEEU|nr:autophagy-related 18f isoform X1 [Olea europaea subsp. europaea]
MRNDSKKSGGGSGAGGMPQSGRGNNGILPTSIKSLSSYWRIVSSGASSVASTVKSAASAASAIVDRDSEFPQDQVCWAGFDKLELEGGITRKVLLLGYSCGFQVWDVEEADNVHKLVSRSDGPVSFMQALPNPTASEESGDKFGDSRPLLIICADGSFSEGNNIQEGYGGAHNGFAQHCHGSVNSSRMPTVVWFYSLRSQSYVHLLRFRSVVHLVRCSSRVVAVLQSAQIHCLDAFTLERQYTIFTNPVVMGDCGSGGIGFGPLAVGPRWMAYSGSPVAIPNSGRVNPQHLNPSVSFPSPVSNGSVVAHYAKESGRQLASGIVTLGDMGYKKLSNYYSELLPDGNNSLPGSAYADSVGMVVVRDVVSKSIVTQFRAHKHPISSLCFDPSGTLLVTASDQGHSINVFRIIPELSGGSSGAASGPSHVHLYRLQRGVTPAVIQDISFSSNSQWIMVSSLRGTSHLFAISPSGGSLSIQSSDACFSARNTGYSLMKKHAVHGPPNSGIQRLTQQIICPSGSPISLSPLIRIRNGNNGWRNAVSGAAAAATGKTSSLPGVIASIFHNCRGDDVYGHSNSLKTSYLLVFSSSGSMIQYALGTSAMLNSVTALPGVNTSCESDLDGDAGLVVKAIQKWDICQKLNRKQREDDIDVYSENGNLDRAKVFPERTRQDDSVCSNVMGAPTKDKVTTEERHHMYISDAELQMHQNQSPLWAKPEINFHSMLLTDDFNENEEVAHRGEIEIEKIPIDMLEVRSKNLVPVFDYLQASDLHFPGRIPLMNSHNNGQLLCQRSDMSEGSGSHDMMTNDGIVMVEPHSNAGETSRGNVNTNVSPIAKTRPQTVRFRGNSVRETQINSVNSNIAGLILEKQFGDEGDEFD